MLDTTNILIVDDSEMMLQIMADLLAYMGYKKIHRANDATAALEQLRSGEYHLVISDWNMGEMSGLDLLQHVRADKKLRNMPFIMATSETDTDKVLAAHEAGVDAYIVKPVNYDDLKGKLDRVMGLASVVG
jgi:two-component system chemotaxis response regulator CheY